MLKREMLRQTPIDFIMNQTLTVSSDVKVLAYLLLLAILTLITWKYPFLFELPILGAIGAAYWLFFRNTETAHDERAE
ncbi:MAG: hypothetical protein CVU34_16320 [Betaproteobacteria bacterium HGW-Betaproteobacteria-7]|jgi:hypothetical protein|nr:MAG: hypothetical protein CVU34_16320 [Betaproteobacteria bacterium HGW-Betaproteobacteria-7]